MTNYDAIRSITNYPIPELVVRVILAQYGLKQDSEYDGGGACQSAVRATYRWLVTAPDITQQGVSYKLSDTQRREFANKGAEKAEEGAGGVYGLKGRLL